MSEGPPPEHDCVIARLGELTLKSGRVRSRFTDILKEAIIEAFQAQGLDCVVEGDWGRIVVFSSDLETAAWRLARVFGVVSVSIASRAPAKEPGEIASAVAKYSRGLLGPDDTFAVRARRSGTHPFTSQDVAIATGDAVRAAHGDAVRVDLGSPDVELGVEVRGDTAYIFHDRLRGAGGLPYRSQGRVLCPVREATDAVGCWMLMRRGCSAVALVPEGDVDAMYLVEALRGWAPGLALRELPEGEWGLPSFCHEARAAHASALVLGSRGPEVPALPPVEGRSPVVVHPLAGLDDEELSKLEDAVLREGPLEGLILL